MVTARPGDRSAARQWCSWWPGSWLSSLPLAWVLLGSLLLSLAGLASDAVAQTAGRVDVSLGAQRISIEDTVTLNIEARNVNGEPDFSPLSTDFDVIGRSSGSQDFIVNGQRDRVRNWALQLAPRRLGKLTVPALEVGGVASETTVLTVVEAPTGAQRDVYLEAEFDNPKPYVQSQSILSVRIFLGVEMLDANLSEPRAAGVRFETLGDDESSVVEVDGRSYRRVTRRFAVFASTSGPVTIEPVVLQMSVALDPNRVQNFLTPTRRIVRRGPTLTLDVQPRPDSAKGRWWFPATDVTLQSRWSEPVDQLRVGEPVTRTLLLEAAGATVEQVPDIEPPNLADASLYADAPSSEQVRVETGLSARKQLSWALIPQRAGQLELPEIRVDWFDVVNGESRTATLPAETLTVIDPSAGAAASAGSTASGDGRDAKPDGESDAARPDGRADALAGPGQPVVPDTDAAGEPALAGTGTQRSTASVDAAAGGDVPVGDLRAADADASSTATAPEGLSADNGTDADASSGRDTGGLIDPLTARRPGGFSAEQWRLLAAAALVGWLLTGVWWLLSRRRWRSSKAMPRSVARRAGSVPAASAWLAPAPMVELQRVSAVGTAAETALALQHWLEQSSAGPGTPSTWQFLGTRLASAELHELLRSLDAALYRPVPQPASAAGGRPATDVDECWRALPGELERACRTWLAREAEPTDTDALPSLHLL